MARRTANPICYGQLCVDCFYTRFRRERIIAASAHRSPGLFSRDAPGLLRECLDHHLNPQSLRLFLPVAWQAFRPGARVPGRFFVGACRRVPLLHRSNCS